MELNQQHWNDENYHQRATIKEWREMLLAGEDTIICKGHLRPLKAEVIFPGVVEIYKAPLREIEEEEHGSILPTL